VIQSSGTDREHVPELVNSDVATRGLAPMVEEITRLLILIGEGQAAAAIAFDGTDFGHLHKTLPKSVAVNEPGGSCVCDGQLVHGSPG
jgi:hypothetical protein